jgi:hypothetical protein
MSPIPKFRANGTLPPGRWVATWGEIQDRYGNSGPRLEMLSGLQRAIAALQTVGCQRIWLDGGFVTKSSAPKDYDCCYDLELMNITQFRILFPILADIWRTEEQKRLYGGEFYAATETSRFGCTMLDFFQLEIRVPIDLEWELRDPTNKKAQRMLNRLMEKKKGIIELRLGGQR